MITRATLEDDPTFEKWRNDAHFFFRGCTNFPPYPHENPMKIPRNARKIGGKAMKIPVWFLKIQGQNPPHEPHDLISGAWNLSGRWQGKGFDCWRCHLNGGFRQVIGLPQIIHFKRIFPSKPSSYWDSTILGYTHVRLLNLWCLLCKLSHRLVFLTRWCVCLEDKYVQSDIIDYDYIFNFGVLTALIPYKATTWAHRMFMMLVLFCRYLFSDLPKMVRISNQELGPLMNDYGHLTSLTLGI